MFLDKTCIFVDKKPNCIPFRNIACKNVYRGIHPICFFMISPLKESSRWLCVMFVHNFRAGPAKRWNKEVVSGNGVPQWPPLQHKDNYKRWGVCVRENKMMTIIVMAAITAAAITGCFELLPAA